MPARGHIGLRDAERLALRDADLLAQDVDAGDHLGHRVSTCSRVFISMKWNPPAS